MGRKRILIVDDSPEFELLLRKLLAPLDMDVRFVKNGRDGLAAVDDAAPDLIVLDVNMPVMNGQEMLHELRERGHRTPVILLTSTAKVGLIAPMMADGIDGYLIKPCKARDLIDHIKKSLSQREEADQREAIESKAAPPAPASVSPRDAPPPSPGKTPTKTPAQPRAYRVIDVLLVDPAERVAELLRDMLPDTSTFVSMPEWDASADVNSDTLFQVVVISAPYAYDEVLGQVLRECHPDARLLAAVIPTRRKDVATGVFDGVLPKPFHAEDVQRLISAHIERKKPLHVEGNVISVRHHGQSAGVGAERFFERIAPLVVTAIEELAELCYEDAIIDLSAAPSSREGIIHAVGFADKHARAIGMSLRVVAPKTVGRILATSSNTEGIPMYANLDEARSRSPSTLDKEVGT